MHLLYPIGLIALAGLLIPLIIHLWKLKQGKTLRIGSIALLGASSPFTSRSYQITDWLLLFLRMLLIALLAFLIAEPYLKNRNVESTQKGWILLEKDKFPQVYRTHKKSIDSLILAGYTLRDFGMKFQKIKLKDTVSALIKDSLNEIDLAKQQLSYYALLRELNAQIPPGFQVQLYADHRLKHLGGGAMPALDFRLTWEETAETDSLSTWTNHFAHKTFEAKSSPGLTTYKRLDEAQDNSRIRVLVYAAGYPEDLNYLRAAVQAIAQETKRNVEIEVFNGKIINGLKFDVAFWMSAEPLNSNFSAGITEGGRLFSYAGKKADKMNSWLLLESAGTGNMEPIAVHQRWMADSYPGTPVWTDGFGMPLLTLAKEKNFEHYRFYTRINPSSTDLVWKSKFVMLMMPILLGNEENAAGFGFENNPDDQRKTNIVFAQPSKDQSATGASVLFQNKTPIQDETPIQKVFWILAIVVFTIERILTFRHKNKENHG